MGLHTARAGLIPAARGRILSRRVVPYVLVLPATVLLLCLNVINSLYGVYLSVLDFNYLRADQRFNFVGLKHYHAIFADSLFRNAVEHTLIWAAVVVPGAFLAGLFFAVLLNEQTRGKWLLRTLVLLPWAVPLVVAAVTWSFVFAPVIGPLDDLLFRLGMPQMRYMNWLGSIQFAFPIAMGVQIWRTTPFFAITLLAGLQAIPEEVYDASEIDGAGRISRFRYITVPLLQPVAAVVLLQGLIWSFFNFTTVFVMTGGGPASSSEVVTTYLWRQAFLGSEVGRGAAVGTSLVVILGIVGALWIRRVLRQETVR
jgi:multiple sugar transport system permease protein